MRIVCLAVLLLAAPAGATTDYFASETLVGWSEDRAYYAVVIIPFGVNELAKLQLRDAKNKVVITLEAGARGVPARGVTRIDVTRFPALAKYKLARIAGEDRERFKTEFELVSYGTEDGNEHYQCFDGGYRVIRRATKALVKNVATGACTHAFGGYLDAGGKQALIKVSTREWTVDAAGGGMDSITRLVAVEL